MPEKASPVFVANEILVCYNVKQQSLRCQAGSLSKYKYFEGVYMIDKVNIFTRSSEDSQVIYTFNNNRNIKSVVVELKNAENLIGEKIIVKYALNNVVTDLILFGEQDIVSQTVEINRDVPAAASNIYVCLPDIEEYIADIALYEEISEKKKNYYPEYFDTDLQENYYLDTVSVFTTKDGYSNYSVFTSLDGCNFELLASKQDDKACDFTTGDVYDANGREARIIRVYIEYNTASTEALFDKVEFVGQKSNTPVQNAPEIRIPEFQSSEYQVNLSAEDTYNEVYGIIKRRIGEAYTEWFDLKLESNEGKDDVDFFELSNADGKILIKGNNGVSLCVGLNHYLKYYCKVNISQVGDQTEMPEQIVLVDGIIHKETKAKVRYAYNYCTLSYSMAFWGEAEWQNELDWLALNGVNVVLDATAQEEVWRRFLSSLGYTHDEIKKYIAGPAYYAWAYMANLSKFGGPVHDSWFYERTELARKNHLKMRKLGMYPVLQGYSGMVPNDITDHVEDAEIVLQGTWCSFDRPTMLKTTSPSFRKFAEKFYNAQKEVYGDYSIYFATDPFHEGGIIGDMQPCDISKEVLSAMLQNKQDAVWIIQSWQNNPTSELLRGIEKVENGKQHALVLDLYAEKNPNYKNGHSENPAHGYSKEFDHTPWVFCMLNNFGGRLGLHGHLDNLCNWIPEAFNNCTSIAGIGITPEASFNNPVLYDFLFESIWRDNIEDPMLPIDLDNWICDYAERRYGAKSESANKAWKIFMDTVYKAERNNLGQGAPESVVNARPAQKINAASTWGNSIVSYDKNLLKEAAQLLICDYDRLINSKGYQYDLTTVLQQILSNTAQDVHLEMVEAVQRKDLSAFAEKSDKFLKIIDLMDEVLSGNEYYLLGRWVMQAKKLARNADDFSKKIYEFNAKALITTWGSFEQCETGGLHDYSNRQWSGLIQDYYKPRWQCWIKERIKELSNETYAKSINWFEFEWEWVRKNTEYNFVPQNVDLLKLAKEIIALR